MFYNCFLLFIRDYYYISSKKANIETIFMGKKSVYLSFFLIRDKEVIRPVSRTGWIICM